jgi:ABC-type branched-subunit amino acid transport system substrate-binding protein
VPAKAQDKCKSEIVLGTTMSLTGPFSTLADSWKRLTEVFQEEFNKDGGVELKNCKKKVPIKFVMYDDQSVPATAVALYERMATVDKVDLFVGPDGSALGFPVSQVFEKYKIPSVMSNVATPNVATPTVATPTVTTPTMATTSMAMRNRRGGNS